MNATIQKAENMTFSEAIEWIRQNHTNAVRRKGWPLWVKWLMVREDYSLKIKCYGVLPNLFPVNYARHLDVIDVQANDWYIV